RHDEAKVSGEIEQRRADASRSAIYKDGFPALHSNDASQHLPRRGVVQDQSDGLGRVQLLRDFHGPLGRYTEVAGVPAEDGQGGDPVADRDAGYLAADRLDGADDVIAGTVGHLRRSREEDAGPLRHIAEGDAGGFYFDQDFAGFGNGNRLSDQLKYGGRS